MTQTTGRFFDELGKLITDAAGAAEGVRKEIDSIVRAQAERVLHGLDIGAAGRVRGGQSHGAEGAGGE